MKALLSAIISLLCLQAISQSNPEDGVSNRYGMHTGIRVSPGGFGINAHIGISWEHQVHAVHAGVLVGENAWIPVNLVEKIPKRIVGGYVSYDIAPFTSLVKLQPIFALDVVFNRYKNAYSANPNPIATRRDFNTGCYLGVGLRYKFAKKFSIQSALGYGVLSSRIVIQEPGFADNISTSTSGATHWTFSCTYFFLR